MVKTFNVNRLSRGGLAELSEAAGITETEKEWIKSRSVSLWALEIPDKYLISRPQQRKAYALIREFADWTGYSPEEAKEILKELYTDTLPTLSKFSLADCSREIGSGFISFLIDFLLTHGIPCHEPLWKLAEDISRYVYMAAINKRCAVCGGKAECHHVDRVGGGRSRKEIIHLGMRVLPLCRLHHTEIHNTGEREFLERYILEPVKADERICEVYRLRQTKI